MIETDSTRIVTRHYSQHLQVSHLATFGFVNYIGMSGIYQKGHECKVNGNGEEVTGDFCDKKKQSVIIGQVKVETTSVVQWFCHAIMQTEH